MTYNSSPFLGRFTLGESVGAGAATLTPQQKAQQSAPAMSITFTYGEQPESIHDAIERVRAEVLAAFGDGKEGA